MDCDLVLVMLCCVQSCCWLLSHELQCRLTRVLCMLQQCCQSVGLLLKLRVLLQGCVSDDVIKQSTATTSCCTCVVYCTVYNGSMPEMSFHWHDFHNSVVFRKTLISFHSLSSTIMLGLHKNA